VGEREGERRERREGGNTWRLQAFVEPAFFYFVPEKSEDFVFQILTERRALS
jgi:hypothetical protein